jgi:phosphoribosylaminoimidazole-succinocarboxamide synthase
VISGLSDSHLASGKIRDLYAVGDDKLLLVASDRISAFDYVLSPEIPDKGRILTQLSMWWFEQLSDIVPNHVVSADVDEYPAELQPYKDELRGRSMLCRRLTMIPVECVARGYLAGSGLVEYEESGTACGVPLPPGLVDGSRLDEPIFTPAMKADVGEHDENVSYDEMVARIGDEELAAELKRLTLAVYSRGRDIAERRGIILADTKFEFGRLPGGTLVLADEVLTPDSSRFWPADTWEPGHAQPSFDKQYVRDWLASPASGWDRKSDTPPPSLAPEVVEATRARYVEAYEQLTGQQFD